MTTRQFVNGLTIARRVMRLVPVDWVPEAMEWGGDSEDQCTLAEVYNAVWGATWEIVHDSSQGGALRVKRIEDR